MDRANTKLNERINTVRAAVMSGDLSDHTTTNRAAEADPKPASAWGPAMRV
ncbi:hypothetical protein [Oricola sp.]|uniref:hypothetical protein n=1 Tax=Oricola sp. TaxID=1979950 RepID=UPI0025D0B677|nr:hypothetical protein [Oricola sp.]MCI5077470.1 hypothetical protein [Oricola sp.]